MMKTMMMVKILIKSLCCSNTTYVRDGPLENLWGGRAKYKKKIRAREN